MSIPAGYVNALVIWANGDSERIAELVAERDALVTGFISGGKAQKTMTSGSANGKSFTWNSDISQSEKLPVITQVLVLLGEVVNPIHSVSFADFRSASR